MKGIIVPGLNGSGPDHWQTFWEKKYGFERVEQRDWGNPDATEWVATLDAAILAHPDKVIIVAHSLGCWAVIRWAAQYMDSKDRVQSALLVAPPEIESSISMPKSARSFARHNMRKLPFLPSLWAAKLILI